MSKAISNLAELLGSMEPELHAGIYAFCVVPHDAELARPCPADSPW